MAPVAIERTTAAIRAYRAIQSSVEEPRKEGGREIHLIALLEPGPDGFPGAGGARPSYRFEGADRDSPVFRRCAAAVGAIAA